MKLFPISVLLSAVILAQPVYSAGAGDIPEELPVTRPTPTMPPALDVISPGGTDKTEINPEMVKAVEGNRSFIIKNVKVIDKNATDIGVNTTGISKNQAEITGNKTQVENQLTENHEFTAMQQTFMNTKYPYMDNISYSDGQLTLKPSYKEGDYQYTHDGKVYTVQAKDKVIQLFDPNQAEQSEKLIKQNQDGIATNVTNIGVNTTGINKNQAEITGNKTQVENQLTGNHEFTAMQQTFMNTKYPYMDNISYSDGQLTLKPSYKEGDYQYTHDGKVYTVQAKDKVIQLFDPKQAEQSAEMIKQNQAKIANNTKEAETTTANVKTAITANVANIDANKGNIANNAKEIETTTANVKTAITANVTNIDANKGNIANNAKEIDTTKANVKTAITANVTNIDANKGNIAKNTSAIDDNKETMDTQYASLEHISYADGKLTFGPGDSAGGKTKSKEITLFDSKESAQSLGALNMEMQHTRTVTDALSRSMATQQQQIQDVQRQQDKHAKAISVNAAFAALPSGYMPDKNFVGIGIGHFGSRTGIALGLTRSFENGVIVQGRYGVSGGTSVGAVAAGFSF